jgi:hypothetical protein
MDIYLKYNIIDKYYNDKNKSYDINEVKIMIDTVKDKLGSKYDTLNIEEISKRLYTLNNLLNDSLNAYLTNDKSKINITMSDKQWNRLKKKYNKNQELVLKFINRSNSVYNGLPQYVDVGDDNIQVGGFIMGMGVLDILQLVIDIAGFIPGAGIVVDIIGVILSLARGDFIGALFSGISVIPVVGSFIGTPGKYGFKLIRKLMKGRKMMKMVKGMRKVQKFHGKAMNIKDKYDQVVDMRDRFIPQQQYDQQPQQQYDQQPQQQYDQQPQQQYDQQPQQQYDQQQQYNNQQQQYNQQPQQQYNQQPQQYNQQPQQYNQQQY